MSELQLLINQNKGEITFNYEELQENIKGIAQAYEGATFHLDTVKPAKSEVATLRKFKKAIEDKRIEVKKEYLKPYEEFETKVKTLTSILDKPINSISAQIKEFEEIQKAEKKEKVKKLYERLIGDYTELLPFETIYKSHWDNKSTNMKTIEEELQELITKVSNDLTVIYEMNSECLQSALEIYKKSLVLSDVISYINRYEQQKKQILEQEQKKRQAEELERVRQEERKRIEEERRRILEEEEIRRKEREETENRLLGIKEEPQEEEYNELPFVTVGEIKSTFTLIGTEEEMQQVEMYLNSIGVSYERKDD